jgi:hypothetical protein
MKYDLGQKNEDPGCCTAPMSEGSEGKVHYPSLYFTGDKKMDIPDEGTAVITFRKIDSGENTRDPDDPKYRCEIEVQSIEVKGGSKSEDMVSMASALKEAMRKKMKKGEYEEES